MAGVWLPCVLLPLLHHPKNTKKIYCPVEHTHRLIALRISFNLTQIKRKTFSNLNAKIFCALLRCKAENAPILRCKLSISVRNGQSTKNYFSYLLYFYCRFLLIDVDRRGRDGKIRTCDLRYPKPSRYQAALRPDWLLY